MHALTCSFVCSTVKTNSFQRPIDSEENNPRSEENRAANVAQHEGVQAAVKEGGPVFPSLADVSPADVQQVVTSLCGEASIFFSLLHL